MQYVSDQPAFIRILSCAVATAILGASLGLGVAPILPAAQAADSAANAPPHRRFTTGGSIAKALDKLRSQLALTEAQEARVKLLLELRTQALRLGTETAMKSYRTDLEIVLSPAQAKELRWPAAFYQDVSAIHGLDATQKERVEEMQARRSKVMWSVLDVAQQKYEAGLKTILTPSQQSQFAQLQSRDPVINVEDRP